MLKRFMVIFGSWAGFTHTPQVASAERYLRPFPVDSACDVVQPGCFWRGLAAVAEVCSNRMQVAWSPSSHGMFLSSQAGRGVNLANYVGTACSMETYTDPHTGQAATYTMPRPLPQPPSYMLRRSVARFGWGGRLATAQPPAGHDASRAVTVRTLTLEPDLKRHSEEFEGAMGGNLRSYCSQKAESEVEGEREYWSFIEVHALPASGHSRRPFSPVLWHFRASSIRGMHAQQLDTSEPSWALFSLLPVHLHRCWTWLPGCGLSHTKANTHLVNSQPRPQLMRYHMQEKIGMATSRRHMVPELPSAGLRGRGRRSLVSMCLADGALPRGGTHCV